MKIIYKRKYILINFLNIFLYNFLRIILFFLSFKIRFRTNPKKQYFKKRHKDKNLIIFGSSKSINNLTKEEKNLLSKSQILFMNKNLIFWKHIGIWPDYYYLADTPMKSNKTIKIFLDTIKVIEENNLSPPIFLVEKFYKFGFPVNYKKFLFKYNKSFNLCWSNDLNKDLFGYHGSITTLLNLVDVMKLSKNIMLVGFDMNDKGYFFDNDELFHDYADKSFYNNQLVHPNAQKINGKNIFSYWHIINDKLKENNIKIYSNNKNSLLVKKNLVSFKEIKKFYEK